MKIDNIECIAIATHNAIYETGIYPKHKIIDIIKSIDRRRWLLAIGYLLNNMHLENELRYTLSISKPYRNEIALRFRQYYLFSKQGLVQLAKWIINYGVEFKDKFSICLDKEVINEVLYLQLMVADYLPSDNIYSEISYLFKNYSLNSKRNIKNDLARAYRIYIQLAQCKDIYQEKEYVDFYNDYTKCYNHTINQYLANLFPIIKLHLDDKGNRIPIMHIEKFSEQMKNKNQFKRLIKSISMTIEEFKLWTNKSIDNPWDFSAFLNTPLIKVDEEYILSLHEDFLVNQIFENLFQKIRSIYDKNDKRILSFLGRPFEKYVAELAFNSVKESPKIINNFIPEFKYGHQKKDSSDAYIIRDNKMLIIEVKSKRPLFSTYMLDDDEQLKEQIERIGIEPINQAIQTYVEIMKSDKKNLFEDITEIYIVSVSLLGIPRISQVQRIVEEGIRCQLGDRLKGYASFDIEEFEYLCGLSKNNIDIFEILKEFLENKYTPFLNFLQNKGFNNNNLEWISQIYLNFANEMCSILFK